jgi:hypothetical protein
MSGYPNLVDWTTWWNWTKTYVTDNQTELGKSWGYPAGALVLMLGSYASVLTKEGIYLEAEKIMSKDLDFDTTMLWAIRVDSIASVLWAVVRLWFVWTGGWTMYNLMPGWGGIHTDQSYD